MNEHASILEYVRHNLGHTSKHTIEDIFRIQITHTSTSIRVLSLQLYYSGVRPVTLLSVRVLRGEGSIVNGSLGGGGRYCGNWGKGVGDFIFGKLTVIY